MLFLIFSLPYCFIFNSEALRPRLLYRPFRAIDFIFPFLFRGLTTYDLGYYMSPFQGYYFMDPFLFRGLTTSAIICRPFRAIISFSYFLQIHLSRSINSICRSHPFTFHFSLFTFQGYCFIASLSHPSFPRPWVWFNIQLRHFAYGNTGLAKLLCYHSQQQVNSGSFKRPVRKAVGEV